MGAPGDRNGPSEEEGPAARRTRRLHLVRGWARMMRHVFSRATRRAWSRHDHRRGPYVRFGRYRVPVPRSRVGRTTLAVSLIVIGTLGFAMPVIGLWMWGPGMLILSVDSHRIRRFRRRFEVRTIRWWRRRRAAMRARRRRRG